MTVSRDFIAQLAIVLAVCVGGWMMLVEPAANEVAELESEIAAARAEPSGSAGANLADLEAAFARLHERLEQIERSNAVAAETTRLYSLIMDRADEHDVTVFRLQPGQKSRSSKNDEITANRLDLTVEGRYEQVADFLESISRADGFLRPRGLQIVAVDHAAGPIVSARLTCEAMQFSCKDVLARLEGTNDDES